MADEVPELPLPTFSERDCALLSNFVTEKPTFNKISPGEKDQLRDLRSRLEILAAAGAGLYGGKLKMLPAVSSLNPNGRVSTSYWACIYPRQKSSTRTTRSFSLQLTINISQAGAEIALSLGDARSQDQNPRTIKANHAKLQAVRGGLARLPVTFLRRFAKSLSPEWHFRTLWKLRPPAHDFSNMSRWRNHAISEQGGGASISRYFSIDDLKERGGEIAALFLDASRLFQPIFEEVYSREVSESVEEALEQEEEETAPPPAGAAAKPPRRPRKAAEPPPRPDLKAIHADFAAALRASDLVFGAGHDELIRTFLASLAAKRFLILTGLSGSGKTQIALRFGEWLGGDRGLVIPVRPDWTGAEALFGYEDALQPVEDGLRAWSVPQALELMLRAAGDPERPYLLILDEMNLAHVERYFADFLSGLETQKPCLPNLVKGGDGCFRLAAGDAPRIPLPRNLFVIGTVNVDETTYLFSPKVFDRANTIEFRVHTDDLRGRHRRPRPCREGASDLVRGFLAISTDEGWQDDNPPPGEAEFTAGLLRLHRILSEDNLEFAHRVFHEASRFAALLAAAGDADPHRALDRQLMQKILPRMHGSQRRLQGPLAALAYACFDAPEHPAGAEGMRRFDPLGDERPGELRLPISHEKIRRLARSLRVNQFASFTE